MVNLSADGMWAIMPRVVLHTVLGVLAAWLYHLMKPALVVALSPDYRDFSWTTGKKGVGPFFKATLDVAFKSRELFAEVHRRV